MVGGRILILDAHLESDFIAIYGLMYKKVKKFCYTFIFLFYFCKKLINKFLQSESIYLLALNFSLFDRKHYLVLSP